MCLVVEGKVTNFEKLDLFLLTGALKNLEVRFSNPPSKVNRVKQLLLPELMSVIVFGLTKLYETWQSYCEKLIFFIQKNVQKPNFNFK